MNIREQCAAELKAARDIADIRKSLGFQVAYCPAAACARTAMDNDFFVLQRFELVEMVRKLS